VIGEVGCIQQHRGEATGAAPGDGDLRESPEWSIFCAKRWPGDTMRCARVWRRYWHKREVADAPDIVGIDVLMRRTRAPPASNFTSLAAIWEGEKRRGASGGRRDICRGNKRRIWWPNQWILTGARSTAMFPVRSSGAVTRRWW
jgi:hypothetical protein